MGAARGELERIRRAGSSRAADRRCAACRVAVPDDFPDRIPAAALTISIHNPKEDTTMKKAFLFLYGVASYVVFFATFLYACGFVGNLLVPKSLDSVPQLPFIQALAVDMLLLTVFALQHSVMARPAFKRWLTSWLPQSIERSTYVLF